MVVVVVVIMMSMVMVMIMETSTTQYDTPDYTVAGVKNFKMDSQRNISQFTHIIKRKPSATTPCCLHSSLHAHNSHQQETCLICYTPSHI